MAFSATKFRQSFRIKSCSFLIGAEHTLRSPYLPRECLRVRLIRLGRDQPLTKLLHEFVKVVTWICHSYMDFPNFLLAHRTMYHANMCLGPQVGVRLIRIGMDQTLEPLHPLKNFQPFFNASTSLNHQFTKRLLKSETPN